MFLALLFKLQYPLCQLSIGRRHFALGVVAVDAPAFRADLCGADGVGDAGLKDAQLRAVGIADEDADLRELPPEKTS